MFKLPSDGIQDRVWWKDNELNVSSGIVISSISMNQDQLAALKKILKSATKTHEDLIDHCDGLEFWVPDDINRTFISIKHLDQHFDLTIQIPPDKIDELIEKIEGE